MNNNWDIIITKNRGWFNLDIRSIWNYRDLIWFFVRRNIVTQYKQTILGPLYFFISPIFGTLINMLVFGKIAKLSTDNIPQFLFYMSGNLFWGYFISCMGSGKSVLQGNAGLFSQVYFPRLTIPISNNISTLFKLCIQFLLFLCFYLYFYFQGFNIAPKSAIVLIPFLILQCSLLGLGFGILISSLTVKYRDLNFIYSFITSLWMYLSPVVYPLSEIPEEWHFILSFNPMVGIIETARYLIFGISSIEFIYQINGMIVSSVLLFIGLVLFNRSEKTFLDSI